MAAGVLVGHEERLAAVQPLEAGAQLGQGGRGRHVPVAVRRQLLGLRFGHDAVPVQTARSAAPVVGLDELADVERDALGADHRLPPRVPQLGDAFEVGLRPALPQPLHGLGEVEELAVPLLGRGRPVFLDQPLDVLPFVAVSVVPVCA